jgi:outer membrane biosynthesis protein TonB
MTDGFAAAADDRLPWLNDEPARASPASRLRELAGWSVAGLLAVAGTFYWLGVHSAPQAEDPAPVGRTTVAIPEAQDASPPVKQIVIAPQPQVAPEAERQVAPLVRRDVPMARPAQTRSQLVEEPRSVPQRAPAPTVSVPRPLTQQLRPAARMDGPLTLWPAWQSQGAAGRVVRVGAFGTRQQAKLGWRAMTRSYPAVAHLQATVVEVRNSRGRPFYRFQIGTTSQAHSEVLCQRMERTRMSCAVVGLLWKPGGVER